MFPAMTTNKIHRHFEATISATHTHTLYILYLYRSVHVMELKKEWKGKVNTDIEYDGRFCQQQYHGRQRIKRDITFVFLVVTVSFSTLFLLAFPSALSQIKTFYFHFDFVNICYIALCSLLSAQMLLNFYFPLYILFYFTSVQIGSHWKNGNILSSCVFAICDKFFFYSRM